MPKTGALVWDAIGEHYYETGVDHGVLYQVDSSGNYVDGVAWNGLTNVSQSPSGAEAQKQYADNMNYLTLYSAEEFAATVEAFTYPEEFEQNDGSATLTKGVIIGQQPRKTFGLCYRTKLGNDVAGEDYGFKLHLVYGCRAAPSERGYSTINDSPEAITFSWELSTTPVQVAGFEPAAYLEIKSTDFTSTAGAAALKAFMDILYGKNASGTGTGYSAATAPRLPLPNEVKTLLTFSD